jgi:GT2 family glycosyltransferase
MPAPVTVAVVSWNTRDLLRACLVSLAPELEAGRAEVWVVDNGSSDGSAGMVRAEFPDVRLVESGDNLGFGPAVNEVARQTDCEWIAAANADIEVGAGAIEALLAAGAADARVGCLAPRLRRPDGSTQHSVHIFPPSYVLTRSLPVGRLSRRLGDRYCLEGAFDESRPREVDWADGAFLLIRRRAFEAVGGFDPRQWMYAEDLDIAWRLARSGWTTRYEPRAVVTHVVAAATREAFGRDIAGRQIAAIYAWIARRRGLAAARLCAGAVLTAEAVKFAFLRPLLPVLSDDGRVVVRRARARLRTHRAGLWPRKKLLSRR